MKTLAAVLNEINEKLELRNLDIPRLKRGQVLVQISYSSICHSQLNEIKGKKGEDKFLPHTLGHEGSGKVLKIGAGVTKVSENDHVVLTWIKGEGIDSGGCIYKSLKKDINSGPISTFLKEAVISENRLVKIPKNFPLIEACMLGCAIPTGAGIVFNNNNIRKSDSIAIFGCGGIGLSSIMASKAKGIRKIIAIDINKKKLALAKDFGASDCLIFNPKKNLNQILKLNNDNGLDYSIDATGKTEVISLAIKSLNNRGQFILAGNPSHGDLIKVNPYDLISGKKLTGTWGGETLPDKDIKKYIKLIKEGKIHSKKYLSKPYKLKDINTAVSDFENGKVLRPIIDMEVEDK